MSTEIGENMKKQISFILICCFLAFSLNAKSTKSTEKSVKSAVEKNSPKLMKGEFINQSIKPRELSSKIQEYGKNALDGEDSNFFMRKYSSASTASWGCHDPKIFQDDDGTYYVYSTGWASGVELRSSKDLVHWTKHANSPLWNPKDISLRYRHMHWDNDFLKWVGYETNEGLSYGTFAYMPSASPNSWAPTVIKQDGKYFMFHGIITDCLTSDSSLHPAAIITLAISESPTGPFIPASDFDSETYKQSTLVRYVWTNQNPQNSQIGYKNSFNSANKSWLNGFGAIDPEIIYDIDLGKPKIFDVNGTKCYAITYGSWKGGIALVYVDSKTFKPVASVNGKSSFNGEEYKIGDIMDSPLDSLPNNSGKLIVGGSGAAYEGAQIIYSSKYDYFYAFVSMGYLDKEYRVGVGRAKTLDEDFLDASGKNMRFDSENVAQSYHAIGSKIIGAYQLGNDYGFTSPGGQSIFRNQNGDILFACHTRTSYMQNHLFTLQVRQMFFNQDACPILNMNEYYSDSEFSTDDDESVAKVGGTYADASGTVADVAKAVADVAKVSVAENLVPLTMQEIAGEYNLILTQRSSNAAVDASPTLSKKVKISPEGDISGSYKGHFTLESDGNSIIIDFGKNGIFKGKVFNAVNQCRKDSSSLEKMQTISFTALCSQENAPNNFKGEYIFGNRN